MFGRRQRWGAPATMQLHELHSSLLFESLESSELQFRRPIPSMRDLHATIWWGPTLSSLDPVFWSPTRSILPTQVCVCHHCGIHAYSDCSESNVASPHETRLEHYGVWNSCLDHLLFRNHRVAVHVQRRHDLQTLPIDTNAPVRVSLLCLHKSTSRISCNDANCVQHPSHGLLSPHCDGNATVQRG